MMKNTNGISILFENSIGVTVGFCHTSNEILTITISRFQNDQNIQGMSILVENSIGVTLVFCHMS